MPYFGWAGGIPGGLLKSQEVESYNSPALIEPVFGWWFLLTLCKVYPWFSWCYLVDTPGKRWACWHDWCLSVVRPWRTLDSLLIQLEWLPRFLYRPGHQWPWKLINNSFETLIWQKRISPPVGVKPNASHLPDEHPRLLDHRGFPICHISLFWVIHMWSLLWLSIIYKMSSAHPIHAVFTTAHLFCTSAWMVYHHLNNLILMCFISMKINK